MVEETDAARVERLVTEAKRAQEEAQRLIEEARHAPFDPESLTKLHRARVIVLRAATLLDEATARR